MAETDNSKRRAFGFPWYYWTRLLGSGMILFGILIDNSDDRSTIILTGAGLLGIDKVARSESSK